LADTFDPPPLLAGSTPLAATDEPATRTTTLPRIRFGDSPSVLGPESERVQELQLRLSQIVVKPKEEWQFDQIQTEAVAMLDSSDSITEREHLRDLLDRIARFEYVKQGRPTATPTGSAL